MKTVPIVTYKEGVTTLTFLKTCVDSTPNGGLDLPTLRARLKVSDVIEAAEKSAPPATELVFEDAVYETAQESIKQTRWIKPDANVASFAKSFGV